MSTEAEGLQRRIRASVRDMLDAYRIQAAAWPVTNKALEELLFRAYSREQRFEAGSGRDV